MSPDHLIKLSLRRNYWTSVGIRRIQKRKLDMQVNVGLIGIATSLRGWRRNREGHSGILQIECDPSNIAQKACHVFPG